MFIRNYITCGYGGPEIQKLFAKINITVAEYISANLDIDMPDSEIDGYLRKISARSRGQSSFQCDVILCPIEISHFESILHRPFCAL